MLGQPPPLEAAHRIQIALGNFDPDRPKSSKLNSIVDRLSNILNRCRHVTGHTDLVSKILNCVNALYHLCVPIDLGSDEEPTDIHKACRDALEQGVHLQRATGQSK